MLMLMIMLANCGVVLVLLVSPPSSCLCLCWRNVQIVVIPLSSSFCTVIRYSSLFLIFVYECYKRLFYLVACNEMLNCGSFDPSFSLFLSSFQTNWYAVLWYVMWCDVKDGRLLRCCRLRSVLRWAPSNNVAFNLGGRGSICTNIAQTALNNSP